MEAGNTSRRASGRGRSHCGCAQPGCTIGFTYLAVLLLVALIGLGLAAAATVLATAWQREQELELLFVGNQYRQAIGSYYENTPGGAKQFPATLETLLKDERHPVIVRHLRKMYDDPMTGKPDWVLVTRADGRIAGVASRSQKPPLKTDNFANPLDRDFRSSAMLSEWKFVYSPAAPVAATPDGKPVPSPDSVPAGLPPAFGAGPSGLPPAFGSAPGASPATAFPAGPFPQPEPDARSRR
jgi:type II secretory pathway pseudopilin PulG